MRERRSRLFQCSAMRRAGAPQGAGPSLRSLGGKLTELRATARLVLAYFLPRMASLAALDTRNFTTRLAGILIASPV
mgnify:CR=1 FL=1